MNSNISRTATTWNRFSASQQASGASWFDLIQVQRRLHEKISSNAEVDAVQYVLQKHLTDRLPLSRCLSIGCGEGRIERRMADFGAFQECNAFDVAEESLRKARILAYERGYDHINYLVADANSMEIPAAYYDLIWASSAIHHLERLEWIFAQVAHGLRQDGVFVLDEYVGPNRFQFPMRQRQVLEACFELIPAEYRRVTAADERNMSAAGRDGLQWWMRRLKDKIQDGDLLPSIKRHSRRLYSRVRHVPMTKQRIGLPTVQSVIAVDPSEAIRSADIIPLIHQYFDVIEMKPLGGTILQFLLAEIAGNFADETGDTLLQMLFSIEDSLMACGDLASDFALIVASPKAK